jgi:hemoglobin/transferrin/lactoferrin receptor protein
MNNSIILVLGMLFCSISFSQEITVVDKTTQQSIPGATVYSNKSTVKVLTSATGTFSLTSFKSSDSIYVKYANYEVLGFTYAQLQNQTQIELQLNPFSMDDIIITANRWEQEKRNVPNRIEKVDIRSISFLNPQTTADLLETTGYAYIQKSQLAGGSPQLRGFGTNRVMLVVDGVRMNNAIYRAGNLQNIISLDANSLEGAEILFGPGAVMYGSDAIGGVMDFRTKEARFSASEKHEVSGNVVARHSTANAEWTKHLTFNFGSKRLALLTDVTFSDFGDLRAGTRGGDSSYLRPFYQATFGGVDTMLVNSDPSLQVNSGYSQKNIIQKVRFKMNENMELEYGLNFSETSNAPRYDRLILDANNDGNLDNAEWYYGPQKWVMNRLSFTHTAKNTAYDKMRIILAHQHYEESRHDRRFNNMRLRSQLEKVGIISANADLSKEFTTRLQLSYGAEFVTNTIESTGKRTHIQTLEEQQINSRYPNNSSWTSAGVYGNLKFALTEKMILNAGVRYSYVATEANFDTTLFPYPFTQAKTMNQAVNGSLGLVFNPTKSLQIYGNVSSGFRAPNMDDIGKVFDSQPGFIVVPNADIKPEYAYNGEVGFVSVIKNRVKLDGVVYYTFLQNALARSSFQLDGQSTMLYDGEISQILAIQNTSDASVYGIQAGMDVKIAKGLSLKSVISFQDGKEYSVDSLRYYPKSHVAPLFGRTTLSYELRKFRADFYVAYNGKRALADFPITDILDSYIYAKDAAGNPYTPAWYTLNLKLAFYANKHLSFMAGVENITDNLYRNFGSGITSPGRNFVFSVKGTF